MLIALNFASGFYSLLTIGNEHLNSPGSLSSSPANCDALAARSTLWHNAKLVGVIVKLPQGQVIKYDRRLPSGGNNTH